MQTPPDLKMGEFFFANFKYTKSQAMLQTDFAIRRRNIRSAKW